MRHQKNSKRLGRITSHRKAMFRNMATSLLEESRIETTEVKAKELRRYVERMITLGKRGDLHARRQALGFLRKKEVVGKVFSEYAERFKDRPGGYTRIMKLANRAGDNARMAIIEIIGADDTQQKEKAAKDAEQKLKKEAKGKKEEGKKSEGKKSEGKKSEATKPQKKSPEAKEKKAAPQPAEEEAKKGSKEPTKKEKKRAPQT
jgi:large subunit ribosomal protein L17